jgi:hypothetical protein
VHWRAVPCRGACASVARLAGVVGEPTPGWQTRTREPKPAPCSRGRARAGAPRSARSNAPLAARHTRTIPSAPPVATRSPPASPRGASARRPPAPAAPGPRAAPGAIATQRTPPSCGPMRTRTSPDDRLHSSTVPSALAPARGRESARWRRGARGAARRGARGAGRRARGLTCERGAVARDGECRHVLEVSRRRAGRVTSPLRAGLVAGAARAGAAVEPGVPGECEPVLAAARQSTSTPDSMQQGFPPTSSRSGDAPGHVPNADGWLRCGVREDAPVPRHSYMAITCSGALSNQQMAAGIVYADGTTRFSQLSAQHREARARFWQCQRLAKSHCNTRRIWRGRAGIRAASSRSGLVVRITPWRLHLECQTLFLGCPFAASQCPRPAHKHRRRTVLLPASRPVLIAVYGTAIADYLASSHQHRKECVAPVCQEGASQGSVAACNNTLPAEKVIIS